MRRSRRRALVRVTTFAVLSAAAAMLGCANPRSEAATVQALNSAADEISGLRNDVSQLQTELDSLRQIVAHQDTVIARLATLNNVPR
jgi:outer membrane murein-binding lipoprotein Lpp